MRILLIEDEIAVARQISGRLESGCAAEIDVAHSRDAALEVIGNAVDYDLIVCDLLIPTSDGALDLSVSHGLNVHSAVRERFPGIPCMLFSGYVTVENVRRPLADGPPVDLFGTGEKWPLVYVRRKSEQPELLEWAATLAAEYRDLDALEIEPLESLTIGKYKSRPLRQYARRLGGTRVTVSTLGGLSGANVFRCELFDASQSSVGLVVAKVDLIPEVKSEIDRYRQYVAPALGVGAFAPLADEVLHGCGRYGAAFYTLASDGHRDLFELAATRVPERASSVNSLKSALSRWAEPRASSAVSVGDLRSAKVSDQQLASFVDSLDEIGWREVEAVHLNMTQAVQHGDLHGRNVLIDTEGRPLIIDYGDVGVFSAVLDAVTLELSFLFHSEHPHLRGWPTLEQAFNWFDLEEYVKESPVRDLIIACREWAMSAGTCLEIAAMVYAHAVRQLKYPDTDKTLALAIANAAAEVVVATAGRSGAPTLS